MRRTLFALVALVGVLAGGAGGQTSDTLVVELGLDPTTFHVEIDQDQVKLRIGETFQATGRIIDTATGDTVTAADGYEIRWFTDTDRVEADHLTGLLVGVGPGRATANITGQVAEVAIPDTGTPPDTTSGPAPDTTSGPAPDTTSGPAPADSLVDYAGHLIPDNGLELLDVSGWGVSDPPPLDWSHDFDNCGATRQPLSSGAAGDPGWGANSIPSVPADSAGAPPEPGCAGLFPFDASRGQAPGDGWEELRFRLNGTYTHLWSEYDLYIPANYVHRDSTGSDNNKAFFHWWMDYAWSGKVLAETMPNPPPYSRLNLKITNVIEGITASVWATYPDWIQAPDIGQWMNVRWEVYYGEELSNRSGFVKVWKNGELVIHETDLPLCPDHWFNARRTGTAQRFNLVGKPCGADRGYILGWANSGFAELTNILVDNWRITNVDPGWGGS